MKILLVDIETAPNVAYVWGLFKENIPLQRLVDSGYVMCWSAKWYGSDEIMHDSVFKSSHKRMLKRIHKLLNEADAIVHYNGNSFDIPTLNKEFLLNGMNPPSPAKQIDLLLTARSRFRFVSNKLDYVAQALGIGRKKDTTFELWVKCMNKDPEAWKIMEEYNRGDVELLEGVYDAFRPWIKNHPNAGLYVEGDSSGCPVCGNNNLIKRGYAVLTTGRYHRYCCRDCGHWSRARISVPGKPELVSDKT